MYQEQHMVNTDPREQQNFNQSETRTPYYGYKKVQLKRQRPSKVRFIIPFLMIILALIGTMTALKFMITSQSAIAERVFTLNGHSKLVIDNGSGYIHLHTGSTKSIIVQGTKHLQGFGSLDEIKYSYSQNGNDVTIQGNSDREWFQSLWAEESIDYDITVPTSIDIEIQNGSGQVTLADLNGNIAVRNGSGTINGNDLIGTVSLSTGSGSIKANNLKNHVHLSTGSGSIDLGTANGDINALTGSGSIDGSNLSGNIQLTTGSGGVTVTNASGQLQLSTSSGSITANNVNLTDQSSLETHSGGINFSGTLEPHGNYTMQTNSGGIDVTLPDNASFQASTTTHSGAIENDFTNSHTDNGPFASLTLHADSGSIHIHKQ